MNKLAGQAYYELLNILKIIQQEKQNRKFWKENIFNKLKLLDYDRTKQDNMWRLFRSDERYR